uniref:Uncharacterized protein n=1 Tax=Yersinia ruckeri TaxID=29486 RepID=A0A0A8VEH0_YERRU|nr:hypothetical protein CSF007_11220 [Yersinia ruckeri]
MSSSIAIVGAQTHLNPPNVLNGEVSISDFITYNQGGK